MNNDFVALLVFFSVSATANLALAIAWWRTNKRVRQLESQPVVQVQVDAALDGMSARLDEFASAQDFMNRVLVERLDKLHHALPAPEPHDTPS